MSKECVRKLLAGIALCALAAGTAGAAGKKNPSGGGKQTQLRISKQYGVNYLPLVVLEGHKLLEKNAKKAGLGDIAVKWVTFGGGATANDALLSGSVDIIAGGVAPFVRLWDKTDGGVKSLGTLDRSPLLLNSSNPNVRRLRDFTEKDKIALPSIKISIQALTLQIAAAKEFGKANYDRLDRLTVALPHPDALVALTSGQSEITAHFTNEPFSATELQNKNIHQVLRSYDVLGGAHTTNLLSTTDKWYRGNPRLAAVIIESLNEADAWIAGHRREAAQLYLHVAKSKESVDLLVRIISDPDITFSTKPLNVTAFSDFLYDTGAISRKPTQNELFFDAVFAQ
jgi:NitT/TauT family transport system substrate-binding protein